VQKQQQTIRNSQLLPEAMSQDSQSVGLPRLSGVPEPDVQLEWDVDYLQANHRMVSAMDRT